MRALLDTDITLDFILRRDPFFATAKELLELNAQGPFAAYVSGVTPVNIFYIARKIIGDDNAKQAISDLLVAVDICPLSHAVLANALALPFSDYEDAVQHASAVASNLDVIITRNLGDYKNATLPVFAPTDFLNHLKTQTS